VQCEFAFPDLRDGEVYPALILCHGGINGVTGRMREKARELARDGYIVAMPSYRGEDGSEGEIEVASGEVDDVLACYSLLRDCGPVDRDRVAIIGTSHGALIAALAAAREPDIPAVVCAYGVMDIIGWWYYLQDSERYEEDALSRKIYGGGPLDHPGEFAKRSALAVACDIQPPLLIIQGSEDMLVPPSQAETMARALEACGKTDFRYRLYDGVGHGFLWWNGGDSSSRGEDAIAVTRGAWDDAIEFIHACWESRKIIRS